MPYYQGDFYAGDFYRGDPGFFSVIGRAAKGLVGLGKSVLGLGHAPAASGAIMRTAPILAPAAAGVAAVGTAIVKRGASMARAAGGAAVRGVVKHPIISAAAGAGVIGAMTGGVAGRMTAPRMAMGGRRRHRMNVCNPRALRRSIRRTMGFAKLAMRTIHLVHPKKKVRFGGFKKHRTKHAA